MKKIGEFFGKIIGKIIGYICCIWMIIWVIPLLLSAVMIDILLSFFRVEKELMCVKNLGIWLGKVGKNLRTNKENREIENKNE